MLGNQTVFNQFEMWRLGRCLERNKKRAKKIGVDPQVQVVIPMREYLKSFHGTIRLTPIQPVQENLLVIEEGINEILAKRRLTITVVGLQWLGFRDGPEGTFNSYNVEVIVS